MIWSAFILGILGSVHCAMMCGPLMIGVVSQHKPGYSALIHHLGRWLGYVFLAICFQLIVSPLRVFKLQQYVGIISGILLIVYGLKSFIPFVNRFFIRITYFLSELMLKQTSSSISKLFLGLLNGLLPCGLSFGAAILSMNTPSIYHAALYMVVFGLGTTPILWMMMKVTSYPVLNSFRKFQKYLAHILLILGCILVIRSMGLGIPYLSPEFNDKATRVNCCE